MDLGGKQRPPRGHCGSQLCAWACGPIRGDQSHSQGISCPALGLKDDGASGEKEPVPSEKQGPLPGGAVHGAQSAVKTFLD